MKLKNIIFRFLIIFFCFVCFDESIYAEHNHNSACYLIETHVHTNDCYKNPIYHTHTDECYSDSCKNPFISVKLEGYYDENFICPNENCNKNSDKCGYLINVNKRISTCSDCGATSIDIICDNCFEVAIKGEDIKHNPKKVLTCVRENGVDDYTLSCGLAEGVIKEELICNQIIVGIETVNKIQYETLDTSIIVTYMDEHTEIVKAEADFDSNKIYNGEALLLSYGGFNDFVNFYTKPKQSLDEVVVDINNENINEENLQKNLEETKVSISEENTNSVILIDELNPTIIPQKNIEKTNEKVEGNNDKNKDSKKEVDISLNTITEEDIKEIKNKDNVQQKESNNDINNGNIFYVIIILVVVILILISLIVFKMKLKIK